MQSTPLDFSHLRCRSHPLETPTVFCTSKLCRVQLCPQCLCSHTEMHLHQGTAPALKPIKTIHAQLRDRIGAMVKGLQSDRERVVRLREKMGERREKFRAMVKNAKEDVMAAVEGYFKDIEAKFERQVEQEQKKTGLHSEFNLDTMAKKLSVEISGLLSEACEINTNKFLQHFVGIEQTLIPGIEKTRHQVQSQLQKNEEFMPILQYKKDQVANVEGALRKILSLSFVYPSVKCMQVRRVSLIPAENVSPLTFIPQQSLKAPPQSTIRTSRIVYLDQTNNSTVSQLSQRRASSTSNLQQSANKMPIFSQTMESFNVDRLMGRTASDFRLTGSRVFQHHKVR